MSVVPAIDCSLRFSPRQVFVKTSFVKRRAKLILGGLLLLVGLLQFTNPARTNPPVLPGHDVCATNPPPPKIAGLLRAACYDCHSHETIWPWYSRVAPLSWWLVDHIQDGRKHLNFSEWPHDNSKRARSRWQHIRDEVESGDMPLRSYTWIHASARLTSSDREELARWADQEAKRLTTLMEAGEAK
jgi:hypothetical protein